MKMVKVLLLAFQQSGRRCPLALNRRIAFFSTAAVQIEEDIPRRFQELTDLHPSLKKNIVHDEMTEIQAKTYDAASQGFDVLGRARTGTGKTVGFLLPALQRLLAESSKIQSIRMLVLSPTRELAAQIDNQVSELSKNTGITRQVVFGGSSKPNDVRRFEKRVPTVLVATPGRLNDHLQTTTVNGKQFVSLLEGLDVLVLDETDRLLDMGFRADVEKIMRYLPKQRQTLLFSATVPDSVKSIINKTMKRDFVTVDCIRDADPASHTNSQVQQAHVVVPHETRMISGPLDVIMKVVADSKEAKVPLKLVVFLSTAHLVSFYAEVLTKARVGDKVYQLTSRKSQAYRTRISDEFRKAKSGILITTDVSARGVDYPGVTHVVQIGIADSRESYIHRLGRTGRAGKMGEGILVLTDKEIKFLETLEGLDVPNHTELQAVIDQPITMKNLEDILADQDVNSAMVAAYRSMLGFYNGKLAKLGVRGLEAVVDFANAFAWQAGAKTLPTMDPSTLRKMGFSNVKGLNIQDSRKSSYGEGNSWNNGRSSPDRRAMNTRSGDDRGYGRRSENDGRRGGGRRNQTGYSRDDNGGGRRKETGRAPKTWSR